ncbi:unnamed protein product, partial [Nesidiocoris tenuis]
AGRFPPSPIGARSAASAQVSRRRLSIAEGQLCGGRWLPVSTLLRLPSPRRRAKSTQQSSSLRDLRCLWV